MSSTSAAEGAVTLQQINEVHANVLDNNPIYKYLLSDVSIALPHPTSRRFN